MIIVAIVAAVAAAAASCILFNKKCLSLSLPKKHKKIIKKKLKKQILKQNKIFYMKTKECFNPA